MAETNRSRLLFMGAAYSLGTFNDNFFKQAALLLAISAGLTHIQGIATTLFALPFVVCAAWSGWLADRFPKERIVIGAKGLEVLAMLIGAWGIITLNWVCIVAVVTIMGLQSVIFGPALNGSIPELFPLDKVAKVNAILKLVTTVTILAGIALAGVALDQIWGQAWLPSDYSSGRVLVGCIAVAAALTGLTAAFFIGGSQVRKSDTSFPWAGPLNSLRDCWLARREPVLCLVLAAEAYFYFMSSLAVLVINNLGLKQLGFSMTLTSLLAAALMIGICLGAGLAGRGTPLSWRKWMVPACLVMGASLAASGLTALLPPSMRLPFALAAYLIAGTAGGFYLIPLSSFIQVRPHGQEKGRVQGVSYFLAFGGILVSGQLFLFIGKLPPGAGMVIVGGFSLGAGLLWWAIKRRLSERVWGISGQNATLRDSIFK
ncbi:MAG: MFS transporter [Desulfarculales bacterium]|jgi:MFS family permease|nr:MFS transporter [Desulfarculales bacterium]